ncbi:hypothetical protein ACH5RR_014407 [Cinchona calisaya]|uniref:Glycosyltransferase n=1 Tax=Cinchona calisaya TaxID=153742 RepID=A0ABD3A668_9GENT
MAANIPNISQLHMVLFPFMGKGHTIPLLDLAKLLLNRGAAVTIFTTKANRPFISDYFADYPYISIINLPFPGNISGIPSGVECTDKLPSASLIYPFASATKQMQPHFEQALQALPHVDFIVSDVFLGWTLESALKFGIPRLSFFGMNYYSTVVTQEVGLTGSILLPESDDEPVIVPNFPWIKITRNDFPEPFNGSNGPHMDWIMEQLQKSSESFGLIVNSFYELEPIFVDYWNRESKSKSWCIGPLCLVEPPKTKLHSQSQLQPQAAVALAQQQKFKWEEWLDQKLAQGCPVLYVAFGTQAVISPEQLQEIAIGLEESKVNFFWVIKEKAEWLDGFQEKVMGRGIIVREWANQRQILEHDAVQGFLSNCGWNSILESICAKVPILAWPMIADQHLNARMLRQELKIGLRVKTVNGSVRGFVNSQDLGKMVVELMEGERGKELRRKVEELSDAAKRAVEEGGSSWNELNKLISQVKSAGYNIQDTAA